MGRFLFSVLVVLFFVYENEAIIYDRCSLARDLRSRRVPQDQIDNFVCFIENNSFNTSWIGGPYGDGTRNFGIFQLNNNDWCVVGKVGGICNLECSSLTDDDITDDLACAKEVHVRYGFDPWWVWKSHCRPAGPDVSYCYNETTGTTVAESTLKQTLDEAALQAGSLRIEAKKFAAEITSLQTKIERALVQIEELEVAALKKKFLEKETVPSSTAASITEAAKIEAVSTAASIAEATKIETVSTTVTQTEASSTAATEPTASA